MIRKTEGIVLRTLRHQDSNLITTLYTRDFGIRSFVITGYRSARAEHKTRLFSTSFHH
ncbi:MAG: recombination protein O N-terminal domain-containing protein [Bacteroidia bacterium]